ncbi:asparagine synthase-related protein [Streptomyces sp. NPDC001156]
MLSGVTRIPVSEMNAPRDADSIESHLFDHRRGFRLTDAVDCLEGHLRAAVISAIAGADRVGVLATGGVDSSVVAAVVGEVTGIPPLLVSVRGGLSSNREVALQNTLARALGCTLLTCDGIPTFSLDALLRLNEGSDFPKGGVFTHVWDQACERALAAGADVLLTGEGGDELFSPGPALFADLMAAGHPLQAAATLGRYRRSDGSGYLKGMLRQATQGFLPTLIQPVGQDIARQWRGAYADDSRGASARRRAQISRLRKCGHSRTSAATTIWLERVDLHAAQDSMGRITCRSPLAESRALLECVNAMPAGFRNPMRTGCQEKFLLRLVGRRRLPAEITEQRKVGVVNQISVLLRHIARFPESDRIGTAAEWLGVTLNDAFWRPTSLPAELGLDWTRLLALCTWASNAISGG